MSWLWNDLHEMFDEDDGSLPEIRVQYSNTSAPVEGFQLIQHLSETNRRAHNAPSEPTFWSVPEQEERRVDSVPNAAALVVSGDAEPFHLVFSGIEIDGTSIPDLGVYVFPDELALNYRMGPEWGPEQVNALFSLLHELTQIDRGARLTLEDGVVPEWIHRFEGAWSQWVRERAV